MSETPQQELDAARRCADAVNFHLLAQGQAVVGKWVAVRLEDGHSDLNLYDTKQDAVRHQLDETVCAYICITPDGMNERAALSYLRSNRVLYAKGYRLADPDTHFNSPMRREGNHVGQLYVPGTHRR